VAVRSVKKSAPPKLTSGYRGFLAFAELVGLELEGFQRRIARAILSSTETLVLVSRGQGKSRLVGTLAVHSLLTTPRASIYVAAASREQAAVVYQYAKDVAEHPAVSGVTVRHLELRASDGGRLRVLASDAPKLHGLTPSLVVVDELHAHADDSVYLALRTSLLKRPGSRMVTISTAGQGADSPLGVLRARGLALPTVKTTGALTEAHGPNLSLLEWALPRDGNPDDMKQVKKANPASWITAAGLAAQREAVPDLAFRQLHCGQWNARQGSWLAPGQWAACVDPDGPLIEPGEPIWCALDVGGTESATALVWGTADMRVNCWIQTSDDAILTAVEKIRELREQHRINEFIYDPWRARQAALELEKEGVLCVELAQTDSRMVPASAALRAAITEQRIRLPPDPQLSRHASNAVAAHSRRGWRIASPARGVQIDGIVALAMLVDRVEHQPAPTRLLGWI
jgi:phage terminase large subunit-like protein